MPLSYEAVCHALRFSKIPALIIEYLSCGKKYLFSFAMVNRTKNNELDFLLQKILTVYWKRQGV